jgi:hypothetical protein
MRAHSPATASKSRGLAGVSSITALIIEHSTHRGPACDNPYYRVFKPHSPAPVIAGFADLHFLAAFRFPSFRQLISRWQTPRDRRVSLAGERFNTPMGRAPPSDPLSAGSTHANTAVSRWPFLSVPQEVERLRRPAVAAQFTIHGPVVPDVIGPDLQAVF